MHNVVTAKDEHDLSILGDSLVLDLMLRMKEK